MPMPRAEMLRALVLEMLKHKEEMLQEQVLAMLMQ
jgi:hypothetical protein